MTNTIGLRITCFFVIIYTAIDQGYMGLSFASCHKDEIWDLQALRALFLLFGFLLFRDKIFQNQTETFFRDQIFPKPRLFFQNQIFRDQNFSKPKPRLFSETKFSETETETLRKLAKVSKPRSFETEMSISVIHKSQPMYLVFYFFRCGTVSRSTK